jgi:hypothetical protein
MEAARAAVGRALAGSTLLSARDWEVIGQGSYHNRTNVRTDSDIDLCVALKDAFYVDGPAGHVPTMPECGRVPLHFTYQHYKDEIVSCLRRAFGAPAVTVGAKAAHVHHDRADRVNIDVVPAFTYELYGFGSNHLRPYTSPNVGIAFPGAAGRLVSSFPQQHYDNGTLKNDATGRRYKRVTRIIKRLRNHIAENNDTSLAVRACARATSSFLIECLVFNCPNELFGNPSIYDDVAAVLRYLSTGLSDVRPGTSLLGSPPWMWWWEVNQIRPLFASDKTWSAQSAAEFIAYVRSYMEV